IGPDQVLSVPGTLTLNAVNGSPPGPASAPPFIPGAVTVGDVNALDIVVNGQRGVVRLRNPRTLFQQDGSIVSDDGVDWIANSITLNISGPGGTMTTTGSGPRPTFSTSDGAVVPNAPPDTRFGAPFVTVPLVPASFLGVGDPGTAWNGQVLDFRGTGGAVAGTPDAVAPFPYPIVRNDGQLDQLNAESAALRPVWGMDLLAYLRCSTAPGDDPDDIPLACLGYDPQRAPLSGPEASAARTDYRQLLAVRDELRTDLHQAFDAYRAQAPDAEPRGADFRRFVEENAAYGEASNALHSLRDLLDSIDGMLGPERATGGFESWQRDLLLDFTPGNMTPELLYEATGAGANRVQTAGL
ncbi:MAG TPA: hypothetical protein VNF72_17610, partial [Myxococcota bacterium]|nr:hypothetical protein [Myxococcota bacterium]